MKKKNFKDKMLSRLFVQSSSDEGKKFDGIATLQQVAMSLNFFSFGTDASDISAREPFVLDNFFSDIFNI
jgi:hypothetical protein